MLFLSTWLSSIIAITNNSGDSKSPWKIRLWIFFSVKLFPPAVNSTVPVLVVFTIKFMTSSDVLDILRQFIIQRHGTIYYAFLKSVQAIAFSVPSCPRWGCVDQCSVPLLSLLIFWSILSIPQGTICRLLASRKSLPLFAQLVSTTS